MVAEMDQVQQVQRDKSLMVNPDLHKRLKMHASASDMPLQKVVEDFLERGLTEAEKKAA